MVMFDLILYVPINNFSVMSGHVFLVEPVLFKARIIVSCSRTQPSDTGSLSMVMFSSHKLSVQPPNSFLCGHK